MPISDCNDSRKRLPNRRPAETIASEHRGANFTMTTGRYENGRLGEVFINAGHASAADMLALISDVRRRVRDRYGVELEEEVIVWKEQ